MFPNLQKLFDDLLKNNLIAIAGFVLSNGLIGGATYVFFEASSERQKVSQVEIEFAREANESNLFTQMGDIFNSGYFSPTFQYRMETDKIVSYLKSNKPNPLIDSAYVSNLLVWCTLSLEQLAEERGKIKGFKFTNVLFNNLQQTIVDLYNSESQLISQINGNIGNWKKETPELRSLEIATLSESERAVLEKFSSLYTQLSQLTEEFKLRQMEREKRRDNAFNDLQKIERRLIASSVGIVVGLITLSFSMWAGYKYYSTGKANSPKIKKKKQKK